MTDRISYFVATVDGDPNRVAQVCRMLRHVQDAFVTPDGHILCILDKPLRDDEHGFRALAMALGAIPAIAGFEAHAVPLGWGTNLPHPRLHEAVLKAIDDSRPAAPSGDGDQDAFVADMRRWWRTSDAIVHALRDL